MCAELDCLIVFLFLFCVHHSTISSTIFCFCSFGFWCVRVCVHAYRTSLFIIIIIYPSHPPIVRPIISQPFCGKAKGDDSFCPFLPIILTVILMLLIEWNVLRQRMSPSLAFSHSGHIPAYLHTSNSCSSTLLFVKFHSFHNHHPWRITIYDNKFCILIRILIHIYSTI